jgi:hypothetical protein
LLGRKVTTIKGEFNLQTVNSNFVFTFFFIL